MDKLKSRMAVGLRRLFGFGLKRLIAGVTLPGLLTATAMAGSMRDVAPGTLAAALAEAGAGDVLHLLPGRHVGNFVVNDAVTLTAEEGAILDGAGAGRVLTLDAPEVRVSGLTVTNSGLHLDREDAGIFLTEKSRGTVVEGSRVLNNLIGIYVKGAAGTTIRGNTIVGRQDLRINERGNGVHVWNAPGAVIEGNKIRHGRDGIFVTTSRDNRFSGNVFRDVRFAVHYMYTSDSTISGNRAFGAHASYALMYSRRIRAADNLSQDARDHGLLLNYVLDSEITGNRIRGGAKCVFVYNANGNRIAGNRFEGCGIGVHFTAGAERNAITGNAFIANRRQVKYVGTRRLDWSAGGRGNFWSDYPGFDLDGDGIGDRPYRPNDLVDHVVWTHPEAALLLKSPAVGLLRALQERLPALYPGGVVDGAPLMRPPEVPS